MSYSEKEYVNRKAILGHTVVASVLLAAYILEFIKGSRTLVYTIVSALFFMVPVIIERIAFSKDKESASVRHIMSVGYMIMYLFVIFTTHSRLPYVYIFPLLFLMILFMQTKECVILGIAATLANIANIVYYAVTTGYTAEEIPDVEIRVASVVLIVIYMVLCTIVVTKVNQEKLKQIQEKTDEATSLLNRVLTTSNNMLTGISDAGSMTKQLGDSVEHIHDSMGEVSMGSTETAEAVQLQLERTEQIQEHIVNVKDTTAAITQNMAETKEKVDTGRAQMEALADQVEKSMEANHQVLDRMKALSEYTAQMNTIIETITSIANSTGMLALNASIEAARAGEAGRGFAVVASQISGLAGQTKTATVNITELIDNINKELTSVEEAVDVVTESNRSNAESTKVVTENFAGITEGTVNIEMQTEELLRIVGELEKANASIVENIQTISAITEEVSAHAQETFTACEANARLVEDVTQIVENLDGAAQTLSAVK